MTIGAYAAKKYDYALARRQKRPEAAVSRPDRGCGRGGTLPRSSRMLACPAREPTFVPI